MKKFNWRYYRCAGSNKQVCHVIQHTKHLGLQLEARTKGEVYKKLHRFINSETSGDIRIDTD